MGAKTALLAFSDGDIRPALLSATRSERAETEEVVRLAFPDYPVEAAEDNPLMYSVYPPDDFTYATVLAGAQLLCDRRLAFDRPSELPAHLRKLGAGRRIIMHGMHSVVDWLAFAVWEDGELVRSLSLSPDDGILENIGEPFDFEVPYWAGEHPVEPIPGWPDEDPYPLAFHPLEMGEDALRALFGFVLEGDPEPGDLDAEAVNLHGFRVFDPTGAQQDAREAAYADAVAGMGEPRFLQMGPDGTVHEISLFNSGKAA